MNIIIKHAGRKADIVEQSNGIAVCRLYDIHGNFLRSRTFPNARQALDFAMQWLYDMEESKEKDYVALLHNWEQSYVSDLVI